MSASIFTFSLRPHSLFLPHLYAQKNILLPSFWLERFMDFVFLVTAGLLWALTALLVTGFGRLDKSVKGKS